MRKKRQGLSTKTEMEGQEVAEEIKYIGTSWWAVRKLVHVISRLMPWHICSIVLFMVD